MFTVIFTACFVLFITLGSAESFYFFFLSCWGRVSHSAGVDDATKVIGKVHTWDMWPSCSTMYLWPGYYAIFHFWSFVYDLKVKCVWGQRSICLAVLYVTEFPSIHTQCICLSFSFLFFTFKPYYPIKNDHWSVVWKEPDNHSQHLHQQYNMFPQELSNQGMLGQCEKLMLACFFMLEEFGSFFFLYFWCNTKRK